MPIMSHWTDRAACTGLNMRHWFPDDNKGCSRARAVCQTCPVRVPCAEAGQDETYGMWGGLTPDERGHHKAARVRPVPPIDPRDVDELERIVAQAHRRLDQMGVPRVRRERVA